MNFQTHIPHSRCKWGEVHASVVTEGSDHQYVCMSNSQENIKRATKETSNWEKFST